MTSPLHGRAAERPFCVCQLLQFCTFLLKPNVDLEPDFIIRKSIKRRFQQYLVRTEISSTFYRRIHFSANNTSFCPLKGMGAQMPRNPRNSPFPLWYVDPHLYINAWTHPLTTPNDSSIGSRASTQLRNKGPLVTIGRLNFTPKTTPSSSTITTHI